MICRVRGLSAGFTCSKSSVRTGPGAMALTLMPWGASSSAQTLVMETMAPLVPA